MTDVNARLTEIVAEYTATLDRIERPPEQRAKPPHNRVLLPASEQRVSRTPTIAGTDADYGFSSATILPSTPTRSASGSTSSVLGSCASGSAKSR